MALQNVKLERVAEVFGVHPRTILRALEGDHNTYWFEDINEDLYSIEDIALVYGMDTRALVAVIEGRDFLLRPAEAAKELGMADRTFRKHLHRGAHFKWGRASYGNVTRYLQSKIKTAAINNTEE